MSTTLCELCTDFLSQWRNSGFSNGIPPAQSSHATRWMTIMTESVKWNPSSREPEQRQVTVFKHQELCITQQNAANQSCSLCAAITSVARNSQMSSDHLISFQVNEKEFHILTAESSEESFEDIGRSFLLRDISMSNEDSGTQSSGMANIAVAIRRDSEVYYETVDGSVLMLRGPEVNSNELINIARWQRKRIASRDDIGAIVSHAKSMIELCVHNHCCDPEPPSNFLPTRLLDIGTLADPILRLALIEEVRSDKYATLSYCWGEGDEKHFLLKHRVEAYRIGIDINILPRTLADTVLLVRHLGIRFLWIDSLCIIQKDPEDWRREADAMRLVYQSAFVCISALKAPHSNYGLFERSVHSIRIPIPGENSTSYLQAKLPAGSAGAFTEAYLSSILATRGWTLQERLLSPRVLHIGHDEVFFECRQHAFSEHSWIWNKPGSCGAFLNLSDFAKVSHDDLS